MQWRPLVCLALIHTLVDSASQVVSPLWPRLQREFEFGPWSLPILYAAWQTTASISQPVFGYWGDRFGSRWMLGLGPALVIVCVSLLGFARGPLSLVSLLLVGGLGIGAFHPEAAAGVIGFSGTKATNGLALFTFGGMVGLALGPVIGGLLVDRYGLPGLRWILIPGLALLTPLLLLHPPAPHTLPAGDKRIGLAEMVGERWPAAVLLLTVATLRVVPVLGVPYGLAFLLDQQSGSEVQIGTVQGLFLLSGGVGTLFSPMWARPGRELTALVGTVIAAAGCLALMAWGQAGIWYLGLVGSGFLLQGTIPIFIAYSQKLLPRGQRLAASLTLGASWGVGGLIVAGLKAYYAPQVMLWAMVPFALAAAVGSYLLPRLPESAAAPVLAVVPHSVTEP